MREWIVTNGIGGYASLAFNNSNLRKYHGLLVASLNPPIDRWVFISNIFDRIICDKKEYYLRECKNNFSFDVFPTFTYHLENIKIKKTVFMEYGKNTTIVDIELKPQNL